MPEVSFRVRWPDQTQMLCYSPSSTIKDAFVIGRPYELGDFVQRSRAALEHASARVAQKFGYSCGHAQMQIREIEMKAAQFDPASELNVVVEAFLE